MLTRVHGAVSGSSMPKVGAYEWASLSLPIKNVQRIHEAASGNHDHRDEDAQEKLGHINLPATYPDIRQAVPKRKCVPMKVLSSQAPRIPVAIAQTMSMNVPLVIVHLVTVFLANHQGIAPPQKYH